MARIRGQNIEMEDGRTVDGRDVSEDGKKLDQATYKNIPNTLVLRDNTGFSDVLVSNALKLNTARKFSFFGDADGSVLFDGTQDVYFEVRIRDDSHSHNKLYYTKDEMDNIVGTLSVDGHIHAIIRSGEGIRFFNYNGSADQAVEVSWEGSGGDWGVETKHASRSDHKHDLIYYPREEALDEFITTIDTNYDFVRVIDGKGNVHKSIQVPWALRLGPAYGIQGLSLNSTTLNNESNKVVRTDELGYVNFAQIKTITSTLTDPISSIYVDFGDQYIKKTPINEVFIQNGVTENEVIQHRSYKTMSNITSKY